MKYLALLAFASHTILAQAPAPTLPGGGAPPPEKMPAPAASPSASATPAVAPKTSPPVKAAASATPAPATGIDALSLEQVQQALTLIKSHYLKPAALAEPELARATLQGIIDRLEPGVALESRAKAAREPSPFRSEILNGNIGYVRLGDLGNAGSLPGALDSFAEKKATAVVLDLRATTASSDYEKAAEVAKRFCAKGRLLFTEKKTAAKPERVFTSNADPSFQGMLIVLIDRDTAEAGEVIAATLRAQAKAFVVGEKSSGRAVEFSETTLHEGNVLRIAIGEIAVAESGPIYPGGVNPDIAVALPPDAKREVLRIGLEKGVAPLAVEPERPRMNEAALVAGTNPELDAYEAAQRNREKTASAPRDVQLQRALDLITTIRVYAKDRGEK